MPDRIRSREIIGYRFEERPGVVVAYHAIRGTRYRVKTSHADSGIEIDGSSVDMTRDAIEACRGIDFLIAMVVCGWSDIHIRRAPLLETCVGHPVCEETHEDKDIPAFSEDKSHIWKLVQQIAQLPERWEIQITHRESDNARIRPGTRTRLSLINRMSITGFEDNVIIEASTQHMPLALCQVALDAIGLSGPLPAEVL